MLAVAVSAGIPSPLSQHTCARSQTGAEKGNKNQEVIKDPQNWLLGYQQITLIRDQRAL